MILKHPKPAAFLTANSTGGYDWVCRPFGNTWTWEHETPKSEISKDVNRTKSKEYQRKKRQLNCK
jgi:hypothetical protein